MITILHGALGSAHQFEPLQAALGVPSRVIEFFGHGSATDVSSPWTIKLFSQQLERALESFVAEGPALIFGYSMGGYVAIDCALRRPDLIARIVTLGTKLSWSEEGAHHETKMLDAEKIEAKVPAYAVDLARRHGQDRWRTVLTKTAVLMQTLGAQPVLTPERCTAISIPIRYGIGDRDEMVTLAETIAFYAATPSSELGVLPGTKHPIERVNVEVLAQHIMTFLKA
ncbi:MAG: thioesterase domain-containing protein [Candidatus Kapabacteria bacterium]|nr:thioesterase domain-containing protein [Candidatus Kapabacteria bacterium]